MFDKTVGLCVERNEDLYICQVKKYNWNGEARKLELREDISF